ncbi:hypothetical protein Dimus_029760 [Dionaea muscipula]
MGVEMDNVSEFSSRERAQQLYNKNVELRRRIQHARFLGDHSLWCQIRDNYGAIVLEYHDFAEQHDVEVELWQFHYKRIEELRAQLSAVNMSVSAMGQNVKGGFANPDRLTKIRSQFRTFLSEATGFYHEFMANIREKYGLQQSYFPDDQENHIVVSINGNKSTDLNKGLISCQRCLIYLGDLARYKGLYGDSESKVRDFAAASSYYRQASSLWPSHGNPYHQLAILVSYSGDEYVAIYYYFRSLAVDSPFLTARENLVLAFEKNRLKYSQLLAGFKASSVKLMNGRVTGKGRGRGGPRLPPKENKADASGIKENTCTLPEKFKAFKVKFVRWNGILFTRTSLETFADVLSMARDDFTELLSSGAEEQYNFGSGLAECGLFVVRLVAILIFTVFHLSENQSYADNLQRSVLLEHAYTAVFEFMGHIVERCIQLHDPLSSYLLPGLLVFVEWLACHPDIAVDKEAGEKQACSRSFFWEKCVLFFNKLLSSGLISWDEDETCCFDLSKYEDCETTNRIALWEDFELRGFLPLHPGQQILDFSMKHSFANDGSKENKVRVQRIIAAGKVCTNLVLIGQQALYFDPKLKKFVIGSRLQRSCNLVPNGTDVPSTYGNGQVLPMKEDPVVMHAAEQLLIDDEDEEEVIVFKPSVADKHTEVADSLLTPQFPKPVASIADLGGYLGSLSASPDPIFIQNDLNPSARITSSLPNGTSQHVQPIYPSTSTGLVEEPASVMNGFNMLSLVENGLVTNLKPQESVGSLHRAAALSLPFLGNVNVGGGSVHSAQMPLNGLPSKPNVVMPSGIGFETMSGKTKSNLTSFSKKIAVCRPVRQIGPPPGFTPTPSKNVDESLYGLKLNDDIPLLDDYCWLDGYQMPSSTQGNGFSISTKLTGQALDGVGEFSNMARMPTFPFPGKQSSLLQAPLDYYTTWQDSQFSEHKMYHEQPPQQLLQKDDHQPLTLPGQCLWEGRFLV